MSQPALTEEQQRQILAKLKYHIRQRERLKTMAVTYKVSEGRYRQNMREHDERLRDFLKEL